MTNFKRALGFAITDSYRNKGTAMAAIFVLVIVIFVITGLFIVHGMGNYLISSVQDKIDVTAYFKSDIQEQDILKIKEQILSDSPYIKSIEYVSREDALNDFKEKHQDNDVFSQALMEVGDNPFLPSLNIVTNGDALQYEKLSNILQSAQYKDFIEKVDFYQKKDIIEKVFSIISGINMFGIVFGISMMLVAILVVLNTMKLIIKSAKEEIGTMRVMGASDWFIKAPFIIEGAIFGGVSFVICFFATLILSFFFSGMVLVMMPGFHLFDYVISNAWLIFLIQFVCGAGLGALSSFIVVNKYLKV